MRRTFAVLSIVLAVGLYAGSNHAAMQQLMVNHYLTGYTKSATTITLSYTLHVLNPGHTPFFNLSLSMVPLPPLVSKGTSVRVGYLGPGQSTNVTLRVVTPALIDAQQFSRNNLFWTGTYKDQEGKAVEVPVRSKPVGDV